MPSFFSVSWRLRPSSTWAAHATSKDIGQDALPSARERLVDDAIGSLLVVPFECEVSSAEEVVDHHPKDGNAQRVAECEGNTEPAEKLKQVVRAADKVEQAAVGDM